MHPWICTVHLWFKPEVEVSERVQDMRSIVHFNIPFPVCDHRLILWRPPVVLFHHAKQHGIIVCQSLDISQHSLVIKQPGKNTHRITHGYSRPMHCATAKRRAWSSYHSPQTHHGTRNYPNKKPASTKQQYISNGMQSAKHISVILHATLQLMRVRVEMPRDERHQRESQPKADAYASLVARDTTQPPACLQVHFHVL